MARWLMAGVAYFLIVFAVAFALGILRVTFVVPAVGLVPATLIELPFTLIASWATCAWIARHWPVSTIVGAGIMGLSAFVLLMGAEVAGGILIFGRTIKTHLQSYATLAGVLGLAGQIAFGLIPVAQYLRTKPKAIRDTSRP